MNYVSTTLGVARVEQDHFALLDTPYTDIAAAIRDTGSLDILRGSAERGSLELSTRLIPPLGRQTTTWGVGLNYRSKAAVSGRGIPTSPILFLAAPSSIAGPGEEVAVPYSKTNQMDYEGEIAVIVGRRIYQSQPENVWSCLAGLTGANDMTARDVMAATGNPLLAKSFPGFCALGASVREIRDSDRDSITVRTWLNGELQQEDDTTGLIFPVDELLAHMSWYCALEPGDVILTGTPAGTGEDRNHFLGPMDTITVEVSGVLPLVNRVVSDIVSR